MLLRELAVPDTEFHWKRFRIRQKTAFLTADKLCEVLVFTNFHVTGATKIDAAGDRARSARRIGGGGDRGSA